MGQKVNSQIFKYGISNFWNNFNYPINKKISDLISYNFFFKLISFFFFRLNFEIYFFKCLLKNLIITLYIYIYKVSYKKKKKFIKKFKLNLIKQNNFYFVKKKLNVRKK